MRAFRHASLAMLVLILVGTAVPVFAGHHPYPDQQSKAYWRYQSPKPKPGEGSEPDAVRQPLVPWVPQYSVMDCLVKALVNAGTGRTAWLPLW